MTDKNVQSKGVGNNIISDCISYLKECEISKVRLGVDKGNTQSFHFWSKNPFVIDESYYGKYTVIERAL